MYKPKAVILDIDGTLVDVRPVMHHVLNGNHDVDAFVGGTRECPAMPEALEFCEFYRSRGYAILPLTARSPKWAELTVWQLDHHLGLPYEPPTYKREDDHRPDVLFKEEAFHALSVKWDIVAAIDDHPGVVDLWEDLGVHDVRMTSFTTYDNTFLDAARKARGLNGPGSQKARDVIRSLAVGTA